MNFKLFIGLIGAGFAALLASTALVATLPSSSTTVRHDQEAKALPSGWLTSSSRPPSTSADTSHPRSTRPDTSRDNSGPPSPATSTSTTANTTTSTTAPSEPPTSTTTTDAPSVPPSTAFEVVTVTYQVKKDDTVGSIQNWFDEHGYSAQFAANLQVIDDNQDLLVPGALVSISNGVMTIHSPV
jgi:hypothetical protein